MVSILCSVVDRTSRLSPLHPHSGPASGWGMKGGQGHPHDTVGQSSQMLGRRFQCKSPPQTQGLPWGCESWL